MQKKLKWSAWIGLIVASLLLWLGGNPLRKNSAPEVLSRILGQGGDQPTLDTRDYPPSKSHRPEKKAPFTISSVLEPSPNFPHPAEHTAEELQDFFIPSLHLENTNLRAALSELLQQYHDICARTNHTPLNFKINIADVSTLSFDLNLQNVRFTSALQTIAARAGMALDRSETHLVFQNVETAREEDNDLLNRTWKVPPTLLTDLRAMVGEEEGQQNSSLQELLGQLGFMRNSNEEASASYLPGSATVVMRSGDADLTRLDEFLTNRLGQSPRMTRTQTKLIESSDGPLDFNRDASVSGMDFQILMRQFSQRRGVDIMSMPTVVIRPGITGNVEVIKEHGSAEDWSGIRMEIDTSEYGFDLLTHNQIDVRPDPNPSPGPGPESFTFPDASTSIGDIVPDSHTLIRHTEGPDGTHRYYFITTTLVDASGSPITAQTP